MHHAPTFNHRWNVTPEQAKRIQERLGGYVREASFPGPVRSVGAADAWIEQGMATGAAVVMSVQDMELIAAAAAKQPVSFPYVPGLLAFREGPVLVRTISRLDARPDVMLFDSHGLAHPRRFGLACHLGLLLGRPSVGCAETRLAGKGRQPANTKGSWTPLILRGEVVGAVVRTRIDAKPVYVSVGHLIDLESSIRLVLKCCRGFRMPEPIRAARALAKRKARE